MNIEECKMICTKCGKDKDFWNDMALVTRIDNTKNCGSMFNPTKPKKQVVCYDCMGWDHKRKSLTDIRRYDIM